MMKLDTLKKMNWEGIRDDVWKPDRGYCRNPEIMVVD